MVISFLYNKKHLTINLLNALLSIAVFGADQVKTFGADSDTLDDLRSEKVHNLKTNIFDLNSSQEQRTQSFNALYASTSEKHQHRRDFLNVLRPVVCANGNRALPNPIITAQSYICQRLS